MRSIAPARSAGPMALSHARALELAGAAPAFRPTPDDDRALRAHLAACPDCARRTARLRTDLAAIGRVDPPISPKLHDRIREAAVTAPRTGPSPLGLAIVLGLLVLGVLGTAAGVGAWQAAQRAQPTGIGFNADDQVTWQTKVATLAARSVVITANGLTFTPTGSVDVHSDPGDLTRWTLESEWRDHDREMRLFLYFQSDGASWWVDGIQTYDGAEGMKAETVYLDGGPWLRTPLGQAFSGTLDASGTGATGPVTVHLEGVRVAVTPHTSVRAPFPGAELGGQTLGDILCSGILSQPTAVIDTKLRALGWGVDWRWEYSTGINTGYNEARDTPPEGGYISGISSRGPGVVTIVVEDPSRPMMASFAPPSGCPSGS